MYEVPNPLSSPYSSICYIRCDWADGTSSRASGVVVGINDVLTALHVVYDVRNGGWAKKVTIIPAADIQPVFSKPLGEFSDVGSMVGRASDWDLNGDRLLSQAESQGDLALLGMKSRIGDVTGWLPVAQVPNDFYGLAVGYPAVQGTGMMAEAVYADASPSYGVYNISDGLGAGASGGPLLQNVGGVNSVTGVLSSGNSSLTASTYAGLFTADTWSWLHAQISANDNLLGASLPTSVATPTGTVFTGGSGADNLTGGSGWDTFTGNGGNDVLDGGAGVDTAIYTGVRAAYAVTAAASGITVADSVAGRDGTDTLRNLERVKFADVSLAFDVSGSAGQAYRLYQTAFNRTPDLAELGYQMKALDDGRSLLQVANDFISSPEFLDKYGSLSDTQFITQLYDNVLDRAALPFEIAYYVDGLAAGSNSRAAVVVWFSESREHQGLLIGTMQSGMAYTV